jgi:flagellar FliJ protein
MAQFKFNLHAVLRQRERIEEQRRRELAEVQARYLAMEAQLRAMDDEVRAVTDDLRQNRLIGRVDLNFLSAHRRFTMAMQKRALVLAEQMAPVKQAVVAARAALVEAAKQRKIMEKLREKRLADWQTEQSRLDLAASDEIAQQIGVRLIRAAVAAGDAETATAEEVGETVAASNSPASADSAWKDTP